MTINQLIYFQAVCKYDGISRAAEALNISQPSISNAIRELEKEFDLVLFTRQYRKLLLTEEGAKLLSLTEDLLSRVDTINRVMLGLKNKRTVLRLGVPPMVGTSILPKLYSDFFETRPQLDVQITEDGGKRLAQLLSDGEIDMAFLPHSEPLGNEFLSIQLMQLQHLCCVSSKHPLAGRSSVSPRDLANETIVLFKNSFFQTERLLELFRSHGVTPNVALYTVQQSTLQNMIERNVAIGFMFDLLAAATPGIVGIPLEPAMYTKISLVWKRSSYLSADMDALIAYIRRIQ